MGAVSRATIHHEGAGTPTDIPRGAAGGYTYWIGSGRWTRLRSVATSYATLHYNHVSVDVCLSGNRMVEPVTDADIARIGECVTDARQRGEVVNRPDVIPHRWSPGSSTVCPGDHTMSRWGQVVNVCQVGAPAPAPTAHPTLHPGSTGVAVAQLQHELDYACGYLLAQDGIYGPQTTLAVHAFQAFFGLTVDGIAGPQTWAMLDYCYAVKGGR